LTPETDGKTITALPPRNEMASLTVNVLSPLENSCANHRVSSPRNSPLLRPSKELMVPDDFEEEPVKKTFPSKRSAAWKQRVGLLAAAFNVCANPSTPHIHKLARRTSMSATEVSEWFHRRRMLEEWLLLGGASRETLQLGSASDVAAALGRCRVMLARAGLDVDASSSTGDSPPTLPLAQSEVGSTASSPGE